MIVFRHADHRYPFLWEDQAQPEGRWHGAGEGPAHYFADTPHGAWAEFLRHEEITDAADLSTVRRQIWAVDIGEEPTVSPRVALTAITRGRDSYALCQAEARRLRTAGTSRMSAPSAALLPAGATGCVVRTGVQPATSRDGRVVVVFGPPTDLVGWIVADAGRPPVDLLARVRHFDAR